MISGRTQARRAFPWPPLLAVALVAVVAGPAQLVLHTCVPGAGPLGWLGVRLALLSGSPDCPEGALAIGGTASSGALVVVSVAVPTLAAHLLAVTGGLSLSAALLRAAAGLAAVLSGLLRTPPEAPRATWVRAVGVVCHPADRPTSRVHRVGHSRRGPPRPLLAT